jgi:ectoine hydroxylase-related dioxygenase (phytanoyl-CoA dioxygenase family)
MTHTLTPAEKREFADRGYLRVKIMDAAETGAYTSRADQLGRTSTDAFTRFGKSGKPVFQKLAQLASKDDLYAALAARSSVMEIIGSLLGTPRLFRDVLVVKPPRTGAAVRYHQDAAYWTVGPGESAVSVWIALDDATLESGCLKFVPASHRQAVAHDIFIGRRRLPRPVTNLLRGAVGLTGTGDNPVTATQRLFAASKRLVLGTATRVFPALNDLNELSVDAADIPADRQVPVPVMAGEAVVFHGLVLHASGPNAAGHPRRAYIATYVGAATEYA